MLGKLMRRLEVTVCLGAVYVWLYIFAIIIIYLITSFTGCRWQGFGNGGSCRGAVCEQKPGPALCRTPAVPDGSKKDSLQDTAGPVRGVCGVSGRTYLRNGKKHCTAVKKGGGSMRNNRVNTKVRRRCSRHRSRDSPASHGRDHSGADIHTAVHGGPHTGAGRYALKEAAAWEIPCWSREGLYPRGLQPTERLRAGVEKKSEEEEAAKRNSYRLTAAPHSPLCRSGGRENVLF